MGDVLQFGRYSVLNRIGIGGMAEVFLCRKGGPGGFEQLVVLKRLLPGHADDAEVAQLLLDEARILEAR